MADQIVTDINSDAKTVETTIVGAVKKDASFFEKNSKATAIGSAIAGAIIAFLAFHFAAKL